MKYLMPYKDSHLKQVKKVLSIVSIHFQHMICLKEFPLKNFIVSFLQVIFD